MQNNCSIDVFTLGGVVSNASGPVAGATVRYSYNCITSSVVTNAQGEYFIRVPACASITIMLDAMMGATASPMRYVFSPVCDDKFNLDFTLTMPNVTLNGAITGLASLAGVTINYTVNGVAASTTTDSMGRYSIVAPLGSTVTVTPVAPAGTTVAPTTQTLNNVTAGTTVANFVFTQTFAITGLVTSNGQPVNAATVNYTVNGTAATATTNAAGMYTITANGGSNVVITPAIAGFTSTPANITLSSLAADNPNQDFALTATTGNVLVSGALTGLTSASGLMVSYTVNGGTAQTTMTNATGGFAFTVPLNAALVVTPPVQAGFTPTPANVTVASVTTPVTANFAYA